MSLVCKISLTGKVYFCYHCYLNAVVAVYKVSKNCCYGPGLTGPNLLKRCRLDLCLEFPSPSSKFQLSSSVQSAIGATCRRCSSPPHCKSLPPSYKHLSRKLPLHAENVMDANNTFDSDLIHAIFKHIWARRFRERERSDAIDAAAEAEVDMGASKKNRLASAKSEALKLSCELLKSFVSEAVQRAAIIAEAEGMDKIEASHLERILPQLLLDF
ncbi:unnamed protein product [Microthlaspi erraticum]|uniref:Centromere protein X n=1 Tax=Microthlaspi erraticum TaxID=1685480 RepID=A0A6D2LNQ3_9BRAS|nr:unnamed protein product [Microthlaspi erraticum]